MSGFGQVVSQAKASGTVLVQPSLADIQGKRFEQATVIVAEQVGGMEDIPVIHPFSIPLFYTHGFWHPQARRKGIVQIEARFTQSSGFLCQMSDSWMHLDALQHLCADLCNW